MTDKHNETDDELRRGLEAAFAPMQSDATPDSYVHCAWSVIHHLHERLGTTAQLCLLADGEEPPVAQKTITEVGSGAQKVGHYEVHGQIAEGGMGTVLKGRDADLGREVALKRLKLELRESKSMVQRFVDEAQIGGQLQHPGILPVYELGLDSEGCPYFAMKLIHGKTLREVIAESDRNGDRQRLIALMEQVCQAMAYAHARRVIHRDLKPANIMIGHFGEVQIADWGLAKVLSRNETNGDRGDANDPSDGISEQDTGPTARVTTARSAIDAKLSMAGSVLGTPLYMAPEQARGEVDQLGRQSDVFALSAMLCEILTGQPIYNGNRAEVIKAATAGETALALRRLEAASIDHDLKTIVERGLAVDPAERTRDAGVLAKELERYINSVRERAMQADLAAARAESRANAERRSRRLTLILALVVIAGVTAGSAMLWLAESSRRDRLDQASAALDAEITRASQQLGEALVANVGERAPWIQLETLSNSLKAVLDAGEVHGETGARAQALLTQIDQTRREHDFLHRVEQITIENLPDGGASWKRMERKVREAFGEFGIDLDEDDPQQVQKAVSDSTMSVELAHALDLWARARFVALRDPKVFSDWLPVLYAADPDPWRVSIRQLTFAEHVTLDQVQGIEKQINPQESNALTYHYLLSAYSRVPNSNAWMPAMKRAQLHFPGDFMLHYTEGTAMLQRKKHADAIRALATAASLRPRASGVWRVLGRAHLLSGNAADAIPVLEKALAIDVASATLIEYANALEMSGRADEARDQFRKAMGRNDVSFIAYREYGSFLTRQGEFEQAESWLEKHVSALMQVEAEVKASEYSTNLEIIGAMMHRQGAERMLKKCQGRQTLPLRYQSVPEQQPTREHSEEAGDQTAEVYNETARFC